MRLVRSNALNDAISTLRQLMVGCAIVVVGFSGGCSTMALPGDAPLNSLQNAEDDDQIAEIRETALADPFPSAAEAGLDSPEEPEPTDE